MATQILNWNTMRGIELLRKYRDVTKLSREFLLAVLDFWYVSIPPIRWLSAAMIVWAILAGAMSVVLVLLLRRSHHVWPAEIERLREIVSTRFRCTDTFVSVEVHPSDEGDRLPFNNFVSFPMVDPAALTPFHRRASHLERMRYLDGIYTTSLVLNGESIICSAARTLSHEPFHRQASSASSLHRSLA